MSDPNPYTPPSSSLSPEDIKSPYERTTAPGSTSALLTSIFSLVFNLLYPFILPLGGWPVLLSFIFCIATPVYATREFFSACKKQEENPDFFKRPSKLSLVISVISICIACIYLLLVITGVIIAVTHRRA